MPQKTPEDFEATLAELEKIVSALEGEIKLEEALVLFEKGMKLSQTLEQFLKTAEQKIEILKKGSNGELTTVSYNAEQTLMP